MTKKVGRKKSMLTISNEKEVNNFLPNEIVSDIQGAELTSPSHIPFAYCYYYLINYLYRYCKCCDFTQSDIKEYLGYSRNNKRVNYIIKKGGILDQLGYTETTTDYPILWNFEDNDSYYLEFSTVTDLKAEDDMYKSIFKGRNFKVKYPVKAFFRDKEAYDDGYCNGTYYEVENTHNISAEVFVKAMLNEGIGVTGFYLYSLIKQKNDIYKEPVDMNWKDLIAYSKISNTTLSKYLIKLEAYNFIKVDRQLFVIGMPEGERVANSYSVNEDYDILEEPKGIKTRSVISYENYLESKGSPV